MLILPEDIFALLAAFAPLFSCRVRRSVPLLIVGAILAPGRRIVSSVLRTVGVETQHLWADQAIARSTPALFGLFSLVTLLAHPAMRTAALPLPYTAWYTKLLPTFADALALVRRRIWTSLLFPTSPVAPDLQKIASTLLDHLYSLLCYAA